MKLRSDFVSNSSSCSFVIAINKEYDVSMFCKDLAKACTNPKARYHNKGLAKRNQTILDFCLSTYELAFFGVWKLKTGEIIEQCAVDSDTMRYDFCRYGYDRDNEEFSTDMRIKHLKQLAEDEAAHEHGKFIARPYVKCYAITMNTINNTRDLLKSGADIVLDKHEDLDKLQKRLEAGEKIFRVHIGHSGEGYGNYEIYCEENADELQHLAVEILDSEPM